ncbi:MAG: PaaI family thioesterase [Hyphomonadaceae bacterium]|nr:PaaI family thioesterase [Hyphomonadaceae bacterium]
MTDSPKPPDAVQVVQVMVSATPYARALGFEATAVGDGRVTMRTPYRKDLIGDPETGVIAGGVITALLDHVCGAAVMAAMKERQSIATLDLRIDYLRAAEPGRDIFAEAHCYKVTRSVAFVRAVAFEDSPENPVANATAAFMIASNGGRKMGANMKPPR